MLSPAFVLRPHCENVVRTSPIKTCSALSTPGRPSAFVAVRKKRKSKGKQGTSPRGPGYDTDDAVSNKKRKWLQSHYKSRIVSQIKDIYNVKEKSKGHFSSCVDEQLRSVLHVQDGDWKSVYEQMQLDDENKVRNNLLRDDIARVARDYQNDMPNKLLTYKCSKCGLRGHNRRGCLSQD